MSQQYTQADLADRYAISELIYRYCRAVDRLDVALGHSIWHDDSYADYGEAIYQGPGKGVIDVICEQHRNMLYHSHQVTNILIELDGDRAGSEAYVFLALRLEAQQQVQQISVWARYLDSWSRRAGRWGLDNRTLVMDFDEMRPVTEMKRHERGRRDPSDPSYKVLGTLTR